jgi:hypothetical protein
MMRDTGPTSQPAASFRSTGTKGEVPNPMAFPNGFKTRLMRMRLWKLSYGLQRQAGPKVFCHSMAGEDVTPNCEHKHASTTTGSPP